MLHTQMAPMFVNSLRYLGQWYIQKNAFRFRNAVADYNILSKYSLPFLNKEEI